MKRQTVLIVVGVFVLLCCGLGIIGSLLGEDVETGGEIASVATEPATTDDTGGETEIAEEPAAEPTATPEPVAYGIGEDVQVGDVRWHVLSAENIGNTLTSDNEFMDDVTTSATFIVVRLEIENMASDQLTFTDVEITDEQGRTFEDNNDFDVILHMPNEEQCSFAQLNPNVPETCMRIFEIPADATGLHLNVGDLELFGSDEAQIDLDL